MISLAFGVVCSNSLLKYVPLVSDLLPLFNLFLEKFFFNFLLKKIGPGIRLRRFGRPCQHIFLQAYCHLIHDLFSFSFRAHNEDYSASQETNASAKEKAQKLEIVDTIVPKAGSTSSAQTVSSGDLSENEEQFQKSSHMKRIQSIDLNQVQVIIFIAKLNRKE